MVSPYVMLLKILLRKMLDSCASKGTEELKQTGLGLTEEVICTVKEEREWLSHRKALGWHKEDKLP